MSVDADSASLVDALIRQANLTQFGKIVLEVSTTFDLEVRNGKLTSWSVLDRRTRMTLQDLPTAKPVAE